MRKGLLFLVLILMLQMFFVGIVFAEEDIQAPALTAFDIYPKTFSTDNESQVITLTFSAKDNLSGIKYASLEMIFGDEVAELEFDDFYNTVDDEKIGTYSMQGILPKGSINGEWTVEFLNLEDQAGNSVFLHVEELEAQFGKGVATIMNNKIEIEESKVYSKNEEDEKDVEEVKIPKPELSFSEKIKGVIFSSKNKTYIKNDNVKFKGESKDIADGKVIINYKGADKGEKIVEVDSNGQWSKKIKFDEKGNYNLKFTFLDKDNRELGEKKSYQIKIDTKDPKIKNLPTKVSKRIGDKVWWGVEDEGEIDEYKYYFKGKKVETKNNFFYIPKGTPRGEYLLEIRAYDKAGNRDMKSMRIIVQ